jgi:hypothetical protein
MNELAENFIEGLLEVEDLVGATIQWAGKTFPSVGGSERMRKRLDLGGFQLISGTATVVRMCVFGNGARPQAKLTLIYKSERAGPAVEDRCGQGWDAVLLLECNDPEQGAR